MVGRCWKGSMGDKVKRWQQKAVDREEWVSVIKEVKALRRLQTEEVSKLLLPTAELVVFVCSFKCLHIRFTQEFFATRDPEGSFVIQSQACFCMLLHTSSAACHSATVRSRSVWRCYFFLWRVRLPLMNFTAAAVLLIPNFPKGLWLYQPQRFPRTCPRCLRDSWGWHNQTSTWIYMSEIPFLCSHLFR